MRKCLPYLMSFMLMAADIAAVIAAILIALSMRNFFDGYIVANLYWRLTPSLILFPVVFASLRLYPGVLLSPPEELKKLSLGVSLVYLTLGAVTFFSRDAALYSRGAFILAWLASLMLAPLARTLVRDMFARKPWWGYPVVVFGTDDTARVLLRTLQLRPRLGLRPVAVYSCHDKALAEDFVEGVPVVNDPEDIAGLGRTANSFAAVSGACLMTEERHAMLDTLARTFKHVIILPQAMGRTSLWATALDVGGLLGLLVRHNLLDGRRLAMKRFMDLALTILGGLVALPLCLVIALIIRLESRGPALFKQRRIGLNGKPFHVWKFRTMVPHAEQLLAEHLARNPALQQEWDSCQKLRRDPRVTRIGRFLRSTSLDELPQLVNVLRGDLSLVGPRPIVEAEIDRYSDCYHHYTRVKPGITGLWQISGRNLVSYDKRIDLDTYYINNWSIWFDIYILARTIPVVITRQGAC
ncbi:Undecaprenyl-phosphate galactose phosphotransferase, WbaP glycosylphosphotransferase [Desulfocurvibacter africanus PCS]|uniref:Undecaprenyl-phosphate galactose phosphotransferase, WbaP glycosylphosphotransferase n=1 Tax=Desulfocurvibacter africanus PCS TaxID=1262666 RepID=M5PTY7_DESAF|nr:Undecaprenyl-phosphate galactose phosphotransferase, WbaP glycosylphosphotransferase [Desulfocurvibacter africanus PCS]